MTAQRPGGKTWSSLILGDWADEAACAGHDADLWFPAEDLARRGRRAKLPAPDAKRICQSCPVTAACLQHAIDHDEHDGVWGGLTRDERQELTRARLRPISEMDHGTEAGEAQHRRRREEPCPACRAAATRAQTERRARRRHRRTNASN